jgi:hypothetical protein
MTFRRMFERDRVNTLGFAFLYSDTKELDWVYIPRKDKKRRIKW